MASNDGYEVNKPAQADNAKKPAQADNAALQKLIADNLTKSKGLERLDNVFDHLTNLALTQVDNAISKQQHLFDQMFDSMIACKSQLTELVEFVPKLSVEFQTIRYDALDLLRAIRSRAEDLETQVECLEEALKAKNENESIEIITDIIGSLEAILPQTNAILERYKHMNQQVQELIVKSVQVAKEAQESKDTADTVGTVGAYGAAGGALATGATIAGAIGCLIGLALVPAGGSGVPILTVCAGITIGGVALSGAGTVAAGATVVVAGQCAQTLEDLIKAADQFTGQLEDVKVYIVQEQDGIGTIKAVIIDAKDHKAGVILKALEQGLNKCREKVVAKKSKGLAEAFKELQAKCTDTIAIMERKGKEHTQTAALR